MKCVECGRSDLMLHRTSPIGEYPANWTCLPCIEKNEPELADNIKDDFEEYPVMDFLNGLNS